MGHLGLQPQSVHAYGGFRVQGRSDERRGISSARRRALEELGAFAIVLECVPANLAQEITRASSHSDHRHRRRRGMRRTDPGAAGSPGHEHGFRAQSLRARSWTARAACWTARRCLRCGGEERARSRPARRVTLDPGLEHHSRTGWSGGAPSLGIVSVSSPRWGRFTGDTLRWWSDVAERMKSS